ncbi:MAG: hypothetical protein E2O67_04365 [Deltaproteobacteria bacterium]|nr:MAG: hypothetical protein E2O67_04365 [Deltaproteobacteria bacterium]
MDELKKLEAYVINDIKFILLLINGYRKMNNKKIFFVIVISLSFYCSDNFSQSNWSVFEETNIKGTVSGSVNNGHIFKTASGNIYEVIGYPYEYVYEYSPDVLVLRNGELYKLIIDGFDEHLECRLLNSGNTSSSASVVESFIDGEFEGFEGETIIKLMNGQIWQQAEYYYYYYYGYMLPVLIYQSSSGFKMKVEGIDEAIGVVQLK